MTDQERTDRLVQALRIALLQSNKTRNQAHYELGMSVPTTYKRFAEPEGFRLKELCDLFEILSPEVRPSLAAEMGIYLLGIDPNDYE